MDSICYCYLLCASIFKVLKLSRIKNMYIIGIASDHSLTEQESLYRSSVVFFFKRESIVIFYVVREFTVPWWLFSDHFENWLSHNDPISCLIDLIQFIHGTWTKHFKVRLFLSDIDGHGMQHKGIKRVHYIKILPFMEYISIALLKDNWG